MNTAVVTSTRNPAGTQYPDMYMANVTFIDGQALTPSSFGQTNTSGVWVPKAYAGTYGTNGFFLAFGNSAALGTDTSGNANTFTSSGLVAGDQFADTPTLNYATLNPLNVAASQTLSSANLALAATLSRSAPGTIAVSSGKWYFEFAPTGDTGFIGWAPPTLSNSVALDGSSGTPTGALVYGGNNGQKYSSGSGSAYGATYTTGAVIGCAFDLNNGTIEFFKNNVSQGVAYTGISGTFVPVIAMGNTHSATVKFGATAFTYTPPTGYVALNSSNLPAPAIKDGSAHFQTALHTGTGSALTINQSGNSTFTSDFVWTKGRSGATNHVLSNIISGTGKYLSSNATTAETTDAQALTAFGSGSISYGTLAAANTSAATYADWMWKGGSTGVSNTSGSITSTVSVNTTAGFSVVKWTGTGANATVGHGLGSVPKLILIKNAGTGQAWGVYHVSVGNTSLLHLNSSAAPDASSTYLQNTTPTSSVFSVGSDASVNQSTYTMVAYCWAEVASFSSIGAYTGNGSAEGPFIYTGFKPAFVMFKCSSNAPTGWGMIDGGRDPDNPVNSLLQPNDSNVEGTTDNWDFTATGFKVRTTWLAANGSGYTVTYIAFASNPFGGSGAAPATAR